MKKTYIIDGIDCPNCAAKLENNIKNVKGVQNAAINFFAQKLIVEVENEAVLDEVAKVCKKAGATLED